MKTLVFNLTLIAIALGATKGIAQNTIFLSEGFEACTGTNKPAGWSEVRVSGNYYWRYINGGGASTSTPEFKHPSAAHTGTKNALFQVEGTGPSSRLITPAMDLRFAIKPVLSFWIAQDVWDFNTDELKVSYRIGINSPWVELESYLATLDNWSNREIVLPNEAKVQNCQIAFEAKSNYGWGVCLDDVLIDERGNIPRTVNSIKTYQVKDNLPTGTSSNPIAFVEIAVGGNTNSLNLTSANITYSGTNIADASNFRLFYTRDSVFANATLVPLTATINVNNIAFSGGQQALATGLNYIWVCADISATATHGNTVDVNVEANSFTISGNTFPSSAQAPSGNCKIEESIGTAYSFESLGGWTLNNSWAMGIPLGGGTNDPTSAYAGQKVLATNLNANYPPNITEGTAHRATLNAINAKYYQNLFVRYKRWLNVESSDKARVWLSTDNGATWNILMDNNGNTILDRYWKSISHDIGALATRKESVMVRFAIDESDVSIEYGGWNIDNFAITGDFIANDIGISGITAPVSHCGMGLEPVTVIIKNYGGAAVNTPFEVGFSTDNGVTYTKQLINPTINVDGEYSHTFTATANLSTPGLKQLKFKTFLTGDEDTKNDSYSTNLYVYPSFNYKYATSFELTNGHWYPSGTNSTWAWGIVAKGTINKASDGTKVWTTGGLKATYNNSEISYLESPCYDFSLAEYPVFSFDYFINAENEKDGLRLEYKIEGETGWIQVNAHALPSLSQNWSSTSVLALGSNGWTGITATDYQTARTLLPSAILGKNNVKFRFVFASDVSNAMEGVAIDNIKIFELPHDVGVVKLSSPKTGCYIGNNVTLTAKVLNIGYRPLKAGLKIPMEIILRNEQPIKDTLTVGALVASQDTATYISTKTFNIYTKGTHSIKINTNLAIEINRGNDTLKTSVEVKGTPGYTLGGDKAVTTTQLADSVLLDAKLNGAVPFNTYSWSVVPPTPAIGVPTNKQTIKVKEFGSYIALVTNENGCTAKDTIDVIESTSDITILSPPIGLDDACTYSNSVKPTISIKNLGPNVIGQSSTVTKTIPLSIMVNGLVAVNETYNIGATDITPGQTVNYTFTNGIDLSKPGRYDIRIYSKINEDPDKNNDTLKVITNVWGMPDVNFPNDTIITLTASTIPPLDAGPGFASYKWQDNSTLQTFDISSNFSAWYKVTVTDVHACGSDKDSVYINAKDLSIISIQNPNPSFCNNEQQIVKVVINNSGIDNFEVGEKITIKYVTPEESVSKDFTLLTPILSGTSKTFDFDNPVKLPIGEGFIEATASIHNDPTASNNTIERSFERRLSPTVSFDPSTLTRVFGSSPYTVIPIYSDNARSFAWKNSSWSLLSTDSLYTIYGTPPSRTINVIAYDGLSQIGCRDTATLTIVADDIAIDEIKSPKNNCELGNNTPVKITFSNKGNFTYPTGTQFTVDVDVDGVHKFTESFSITTALTVNEKRDTTLNNKLNLLGKTNASIQATISTALDVVADNNVLNKTIYATGYPTVNIGSNRTIHEWSDTLSTGANFQSYEWLHNNNPVGTDSTFVATASGSYKVNVVDYNGCSGTSNQITLTFVVDDISLKTLNNPQTGCGLTLTEPVKVTVENTGSEIYTSGKQLTIGFKQIAPPNTTIASGSQIFTLGSNLTSGQTRTFDLTNTMSFPNNIEYNVKVWVKTTGDMRSNNDTLFTTISSYPSVLYNQFNVDTIETSAQNYTLDAGNGFNSYLWNTTASTQTILVTSSGKYIVEVTNINGCKAKDSVYVKFIHDLSVESLVTPLAVNCALSTAQTVTVRLKNLGNNTLHSGEVIKLTLKKDGVLAATENLNLTTDWANGANYDYTFIHKPDLSNLIDFFLEVSLALKEDNNSLNNIKSFSIRANPNPTPNLGPDKYFLADTVISPGTFNSYLWQDNSTNPTYTVTQTGTYTVTVTDANNCSASDAVTLTKRTASDIRITALTSPSTNCFNSLGQTVTATLTNKGSRTFTSGESIKVSYQINSETPVEETLTFNSNFAYNQSINYTFTQKAIINPGAVSMVLKTTIDGVGGAPSATYPITINANPTVDLGPDRNFSVSEVLDAGPGFTSYKWQDNSTNRTFTATATGKYSVTVTNSSNCQGYDEVNLTLTVGVETIPGTNAKVTYYPNPVNNELTVKIETDKQEEFTIDLVSPNGQVVKNIKTEKTLFYSDKIDVKGYNSGLYLLKVGNGKGSATFKVIVQK